MEYMNCMSCNKVESPMRRYHSRVPFLSQHRFLAETRCEVTSAVSMTENHTLSATKGKDLVAQGGFHPHAACCRTVILSAAKDLVTHRARPFAALRVTLLGHQ